MATPTTKTVNDLLRRAQVLRRHYDLACAYIAQDPQIMNRMQDELVAMRAECAEDTTPHEKLTVEISKYSARTGQRYWTASRASAEAMAR